MVRLSKHFHKEAKKPTNKSEYFKYNYYQQEQKNGKNIHIVGHPAPVIMLGLELGITKLHNMLC